MKHVFIGHEREIICFCALASVIVFQRVVIQSHGNFSRLWLRDWIVTDAKTETGWTLSRTKEQGDKLEVVLNGMLSVCPSVGPH
jgi:hypothetical protein